MSDEEAGMNFSMITNDEYKKASNFEIVYGITSSKFGNCLIGMNDDKICHVALFDEGKENSAIDNLQSEWPEATLKSDDAHIKSLCDKIFSETSPDVDVLLRGTELQCNVWKELVKVKRGSTTTYEQIAKAVGKPKAIRAVAGAIAKNKIAYLIPCHRVIRKTGAPNKYRWGPERKMDILKWESEQ